MERAQVEIGKSKIRLRGLIKSKFGKNWLRFNRRNTLQFIKFLAFGILVGNVACNSNASSLFLKVEKIEKAKQITLYENKDYPIGRIWDATISSDSLLWLLDMAAADIKLFNLDGKFIRKLSGRGEAANALQLPRTLEVTRDYILVADIGSKTTKWFNKEGTLIREISVNRLRPIIGNTKLISENKILHAALWDGTTDFTTAIHLIDSSGKILQKLGSYPSEYDDYVLTGNRQIDYNPQTKTYVITFLQSPALVIGNLANGEEKTLAFEKERSKYISSNRPKGIIPSLDLVNKLTLEEAANDRVLFLTDSILVRSYFHCTEESLKKRSSVLDKHFLEAYSIWGEYLGEVQLPGRLHGKHGDLLLIEESDEPDNRIFGLYALNFKKTNIMPN